MIPLDTTVKSTGPLWTAFVANPTDSAHGAGGWWPLAYTLPDVALNHPSRWSWTPPTPTQPDVLTFNFANTSEPVLSEFYWMKGLYITPASADGQGPQMTTARAGTILQLQARVYNYSLADMPTGTTVHVRFYGQPWVNSDFSGAAFLINSQDVVLPPIPGFNSQSTTNPGALPNWALANTTFDTTDYADTDLVFWVVVWMEQNGQLAPELPGHGLTANPASRTFGRITDVPTQPYSNNVGFYKQPFSITSPVSTAQRSATTAAATLAVKGVTISPTMRLSEKATVTTTFTTGPASLNAVVLFYYDGDPEQGGEAFDTELVPHTRANEPYVNRIKYQPRTCGTHTVVVVAKATAGLTATGTASVDVSIDPVASVDTLITATTDIDLPEEIELKLVAKLEVAQKAFEHNFPQVAVNRLKSFIGEVEVQRGQSLTEAQADLLIAQAKHIIGCV